MSLQIAYNKIALQGLEKALMIRESALSTIRSKESALRTEVKKQLLVLKEVHQALLDHQQEGERFAGLWSEWDTSLVSVHHIQTRTGSFAGVRYRIFERADISERPFDFRSNPPWWPQGVSYVKQAYTLQIRYKLQKEFLDKLEKERKKTTQKLNLYEKVQIPECREGIRKIKRFLEDQETLEKATQKIVKKKKSNLS